MANDSIHQFQLGSVSTGTLQAEDLLPILSKLSQEDVQLLNHVLSTTDVDIFAPELVVALNNLCPPFVYFGARPCDCSGCDCRMECKPNCASVDFGFWPDMDALDDILDLKPGYDYIDSEWVLPNQSVRVHIHNYGNVTVMDLDHNVLWSTG